MLSLQSTIRKERGRKTRKLREKGLIPGVLYGPEIKEILLEVEEKPFEKVFKQAGGSSLLSLAVEGKNYEVLIHELARDSLSGKYLHIDFYCPSATKEITAEIPLVFEGEPLAVKNLGGILVKGIQQLKVKGLARNLPREIKVDVSYLAAFDDRVRIGDLKIPQGVHILKHHQEEIVASVLAPQKEAIEAKPIQETEELKGESKETGETKTEKKGAG